MSYGVRKLPIGGLSPDVTNALIVAVIIAKQNHKTFTSRKDGQERGVWNFTLRDSTMDTINATVWGSAEYIQDMVQVFNVGDVVEIVNPRISFKRPGATDSTFSPTVSSPFQLQLQEDSSTMLLYAEDDVDFYRELIHVPFKEPGDYLKLSDVLGYGQAMVGEYVNLLVAVRNIGEIRNVKSKKDSRDFTCRHITVMDQSRLEFHMTLWDQEIIQRSNDWRARETIIFLADVRLDWDSFRNTITASINSRSVITENPRITEAATLEEYARTAPILPAAVLDYYTHNVIDARSISTVMTTAQVLDRAYSRCGDANQFTAIVYASITHLDLDGSEVVIVYKCSCCSQVLDGDRTCLNAECSVGGKRDLDNPQVSFNLKMDLTDHRGTLYNCRFVSPVADEVFGCSAQQYLSMTNNDKTQLKWTYLLTRCEVRILIMSVSPERPQPLVSIVACKPMGLKEVADKLPYY